MKMDRRFKYLAAAVCLLASLAGCREEMVQRGSYVEPGCGVLRVSVGCGGTLTRAVGDYLPEVTLPEERAIGSIAFFVRTENDTKDGKTLAGTFARFFSHATDPELALAEPLTEMGGTGSGLYNCGIRMYSDSWKNPKVIVVANYVENGLTDALEKVERWDDLADLMTEADVLPSTPLLMRGGITEGVGWTDAGGVVAKAIDLERVVARVDVRNEAFDDTDPTRGFVLQSVSLVRPKSASFLLPPTEGMMEWIKPAAAGVYPETALSGDELTDKDKQKVDALYVYENLNLDPDGEDTGAMAVRVAGTYETHPVVKTVVMARENGTPVALSRNHRYLVLIQKGADPQEPKFTVKVADWERGDSVSVTPTFKVPAFDNVDKSKPLVVWDKEKRTYTVPAGNAADPGYVKFKVKSESQSFIAVDTIAVYKAAGDSVVGHSALLKGLIEPDAAGIVYTGADFSCAYKLTLPVKAVDGADKEPLYSLRLVFANSVYKEATDTLTIKYD